MDTVELVNVHYTLLQYVYDKKVLHLSCFNHVWEDFRTIHDDFQNFRPGLIAIKKIENWGDKMDFFRRIKVMLLDAHHSEYHRVSAVER